MSLPNNNKSWLKRGQQRAAVAQALRKPMTASQICAAARTISPHIRLRDVWFLLRQLEDRGMVARLNPKLVTGSLYLLTPNGKEAVFSAFQIPVAETPEHMNWPNYSWVVRAKIRRKTLEALDQLERKTNEAQTATELRKQVRANYPVGLNPVLRAVRELASHGLVNCVGLTRLRSCKQYRLSSTGRAIVNQLKR